VGLYDDWSAEHYLRGSKRSQPLATLQEFLVEDACFRMFLDGWDLWVDGQQIVCTEAVVVDLAEQWIFVKKK
jgi:hypothetical protein